MFISLTFFIKKTTKRVQEWILEQQTKKDYKNTLEKCKKFYDWM